MTPTAPHYSYHPQTVSPLLPLAAILSQQHDLVHAQDAAERAYLHGCVEGELAFALATHPSSASLSVSGCLDALLLHLGLEHSPLTCQQQRLRGWVIGLFGTLADALEQEEQSL
ncbi:hypothetical protein HZU77_015895 [Neisseriaceae bacterium TC5R-5]|nr:hypothetical protein [Neisseriaceae bacterium TC5R-5]